MSTDSHLDPKKSTFYLFGELDPAETAFFNAQEQPAGKNHGRVEVFGHRIGYWEAGRDEPDVWNGVNEGRSLLDLVTATYTVLGGVPYVVSVKSWVEAKGVVAVRTMLGSLDQRLWQVGLLAESDPQNVAMREAVAIADTLRKSESAFNRLAVRDLHTARRESGPDAYMYAYRAVEAVRQAIAPGEGSAKEWAAMHEQLGTTSSEIEELNALSKLARHGKLGDPSVTHADRETVLEAARHVVRLELKRVMKRDLETIDQNGAG